MQILRINSRRYIFLLMGLLSAGFAARATDGGGVVRAMSVLDGSHHQISVDSSRTVQDSTFFNPAYVSNLDTAYTVQNIVTVKINEESLVYLRSAFTATVRLRITYTVGAGQTDSVDRNFTVKYDSATAYDGRNSFVFYGGRKVTVKVLSVNTNATGWDPLSAMLVENLLVTRPKFIFSCSNLVNGITLNPSADTAADELPVNWTAVLGADSYDLEWTYIDASALRNHKYGYPTINLAQVFQNNATRASISGNSYNIPLMYDDSGTLFVRVRPVQFGPSNSVISGPWSTEASTPVVGQMVFKGHERAMNWQSSINFAEEGKRKVVLQYFDGSLRSRQTVTKDNTTNTTIVSETYYDYQGRPVIQVMPSPSIKSIIRYTNGFNVSINGAEYSQSNYDSLPGLGAFCGLHADSMSNISGASQYYSQNNPNRTAGLNQFIPDAKGYPFSETEFTPDNTGRISRQGIMGTDFQLGGGHETKYFYGTPDQNELDALFGTEVGDKSHYFKNVVRDANGQYNVSYVDLHGRTVATALAGNAPSSLSALPSNTARKITETLADSSSVFLQDLSMTSQKSLVVPMADTFQFHYSLTPDIFQEKNCQNANVCYTCKYDLEISISDNCNNQLLPGAKAFDTVIHNFSLGSISPSCTSPAMGVDFSLVLAEGSYVVTKKLTVSKDAYNFYRDSVYLPGNTCSNLQQVINNQASIIAATNTQCTPDCSSCRANVGTWSAFLQKFIMNSGLNYPGDTAAYRGEAMAAYNGAISACDLLCGDKNSDVDDIRKAMLQDMTPPFGQYADTAVKTNKDKYSVFYTVPGDTTWTPTYRLDAIVYTDDSGKPDSVYNEQSGLMVDPGSLSTSQFVQNWRASWAEALLPYHPEYCKLLAMQNEAASNQWDRKMEAIDDYQTAHDQGYLNPTGKTGQTPFSNYPIVSGSLDPLFTAHPSLKTNIENKLKVYQVQQGATPALSMWALACTMVKCNTNDAACIVFYANNNPGYDFNSNMCTGDLDMAWRNFRELYLGVKHDIEFQQLIDKPQGCTMTDNRVIKTVPTAEILYSLQHQPEFTDTKTSLTRSALGDLNKVNSPGAATTAANTMNDSIALSYDQNCHAYASRWADQLSVCTYYSQTELNNVIIPRLYTLCRLACDADHPFGASTLPSGVSYPGQSWRSFQDIITAYNAANGISDNLHCNAEAITEPKPYDLQPVYSMKSVYSRPSDCECKLINDLYNIYTLTGKGDASFSAYLLRTQQISMTDADLNTLRNSCKNTTNSSTCSFLSHPIYLPPAMQCNSGTACASCQTVSGLYTSYQLQYPSQLPSYVNDGDSVQARKNTLFQNYMNNRLGYNKMAWEYLQFLDTCAAHTADTATQLKCTNKTIADLFNTNGLDTMSDMRRLPDGGFIMVGRTTGAAGKSDAYIMRYDSLNNIQWAKAYGGTDDDDFNKVRVTSDGGYIAIGETFSTSHSAGGTKSDVLIVRMDSRGNTIWERTIGVTGTRGERGYDIIQTADGGFAAIGMYDIPRPVSGNAKMLVLRLNSAGTTLWMKAVGSSSSNDGSSIMQKGDTLVLSGRGYDGTRYLGALIKLNQATGTYLGSYWYQDNTDGNQSCSLADIYPTTTGYQISAYSNPRYFSTGGRMSVLNITNGGAINSYTVFNAPPGNSASDYVNFGKILRTSDGGYIIGQTGTATNNITWIKMSSTNTQQWARITKLPYLQTIGTVDQNADSSYVVLGTDYARAMLLRLSSTGTTGCYDSTITIGTSTPPLVIGNSLWSTDAVVSAGWTDTAMIETIVSTTDSVIACAGGSTCYTIYNGPTLCGKAQPILPPVTITPVTTCTDSTFFSVSKGTVIYNAYTDSLTGDFEKQYANTCLQAYKHEVFTVTHSQREYHYTLYYYDQAGLLLKTIPPAGVQQNTDTAWLRQVRTARANGQVLTPAHTLATSYRYNTLSQVVAQFSPDGGTRNFWYDRLGRLVVTQNARQKLNNLYSYTKFDTIGRIVQAGELTSATGLTDAVTRNEAALQTWQNNAAASAEQITVTTYDTSSYAIIPELAPKNLRNRVSWRAIYATYPDMVAIPGNHRSATYYSYDILGNVDTLVQDYKAGSMAANGNRFKKLVYDYDLISGKVNRVAYQHANADAFYHSYIYDAENRITNVASSTDSINWDNDAFYSYYAHGPLARTILGQQQVQGINYAFALQGWLKAVNPDIYTGGSFTLRPDSSGNVVASSAYNLLLNYFNGDYTPISGASAPDAGVSTTLGSGNYHPLYNGNISSMGVSLRKIGNSLLYNYQYDQLNRMIQMDAWNRTATGWSSIVKVADLQESVSYDPNGNIVTYRRNGNNSFAGKPLDMDKLKYNYRSGTNQLDYIIDTVADNNYAGDIDNQTAGNYKYDSIGELISDNAAHITNVTWTVYGKIGSITKTGDTTIFYSYDASGHRISRSVIHSTDTTTTWYVRDDQGNALSVYTYGDPSVNGRQLTQTELDIYGSTRLGTLKRNVNVEMAPVVTTSPMRLVGSGDSIIFTRGNKSYELVNHLGNVLVTISDKRFGVKLNDSTVAYFIPDVASANDYYPFGMIEPGRTYSKGGDTYRYGFNGQERSEEVVGDGNSYTAEFWEYDPRIGKRWNMEPEIRKYPWLSPYAVLNNNPIQNLDPNGNDPITGILEALSSFAIEAGSQFLTNWLLEGKDAKTAFDDIKWSGAVVEGAKTYLFSFFVSGAGSASKIAKLANTTAGKIIIKTVENMTTDVIKDFAAGEFNDNRGDFSFSKFFDSEKWEKYFVGGLVGALLEKGFEGKAEELLEKLHISKEKLGEQYKKLFHSLEKANPNALQKTVNNRVKKIIKQTQDVTKKAIKHRAYKASSEIQKNFGTDEAKKIIEIINKRREAEEKAKKESEIKAF